MIYFDNSATSWPKPPAVADAMISFMREIGANPGRAGHRLANEAGRIVYETREAVAQLFNFPDPLRVVFTANVTESLNLALCGLLKPGDHVITSSIEHNSMMRPLRYLQKLGVELTIVQCSGEGILDPHDISHAVKTNTKIIALNHASNVTGSIQPVREVGAIAREHNLLLLLDTAQTAGSLPIDMSIDSIDLLAFTGHKSLLGPMGTGGLIFGQRADIKNLKPLKRGGTGSRSSEEVQPEFLPDLCESGTLNVAGLAGLQAGIRWVLQKGVDAIHAFDLSLMKKLTGGLQSIKGCVVYGPGDISRRTGTVSFTITGASPSDIGMILDEKYDLLCRVGLHCSPQSHKTIGTYPYGAVRFGLGIFNSPHEIDGAIAALEQIVIEYK